MLGGVLKLMLSLSALLLFVTLLWQLPIADALPTSAVDGHLIASDDKSSPLFVSNSHSGLYNKNLRAAKRLKAVMDNRLKRFRMLDPDEFQEMLTAFNHQIPHDQSKATNGIDTVGGMQVENYWSRK